MSGPRTLATAAGELTVLPLSPEALRGLTELFPRVGTIEHEGAELLALATSGGGRVLHGLRTGYGHFMGEKAPVARKAALFGRMCLPTALVTFRARGLDGVVMAAACVSDNGSGATQEGEMLFVHARSPLVGGLESEPLPTWEKHCGPDTTAALLTLITDVGAAWRSHGVESRTLTDMEPCPAHWPGVRWFADLVLVDGRFVFVRPTLDPGDPFLGALVMAGIREIEWTPSAFALSEPEADPDEG